MEPPLAPHTEPRWPEPTLARHESPAAAPVFAERQTRQDDDPERDFRRRQNKLRGLVVTRLVLAARRLIRADAERRFYGQHPLSRHFLVFFYREPALSEHDMDYLRVATRIDQAGDDVADLHAIVTQLQVLANRYVSMGRFDPRDHLTNRVEKMSPAAQYVGLGVGTLDPKDMLDGAKPGALLDERPLWGIAVLNDGTKMMVRWKGGVDTPSTMSNATMDTGPWTTRRWAWGSGQFLNDPETEDGRIGLAVTALHEFLMQHYGTRLTGIAPR